MSNKNLKPGPQEKFDTKLEKKLCTLLTVEQWNELDNYCKKVKASKGDVVRTGLELMGVLKVK